MVLCFDEFELDTDLYELRLNGQCRKLEPKVFDLVTHFARHPDQVFTRDELVEAVWDGRFVSDTTVSTCIKSARKALGDSGDKQTYIKTVRGRGFRFTAKVGERETHLDEVPARPTTRSTQIRSTEPSLLVLPFRTLSDQRDAIRLAEALTSDLSTILTRIPLLRLSAQSTKYNDRKITPSAREIHEDFGVDYVVDASLRELEGLYRITVQLSDAKSGFQVWAEQFAIPGPVGAVLDKGVIAIIAKLEPQLHRAIYNTLRAADGEPNARQLFLEASGILALKGWHHDSLATAAGLLRRSWALEEDFALAPSCLSLVVGLGDRFGLIGDREKSRSEALEAAERSLQLDGLDSTVLGFSGCALADIGYPERALPILKNAVEINPANAQAWAALGSACLIQQRLDEAVENLGRGISISPLDSRLSIWGAMLTLALMLSDDLEEALQQGQLACQRDDRSYLPRIVLAAVHLVRDEAESAARLFNDVYRIKPDLSRVQIASVVGKKLGSALLKLRRSAIGAI